MCVRPCHPGLSHINSCFTSQQPGRLASGLSQHPEGRLLPALLVCARALCKVQTKTKVIVLLPPLPIIEISLTYFVISSACHCAGQPSSHGAAVGTHGGSLPADIWGAVSQLKLCTLPQQSNFLFYKFCPLYTHKSSCIFFIMHCSILKIPLKTNAHQRILFNNAKSIHTTLFSC